MYQMEQKNADIMNAKNVGIDSSHYRRWRRFHVQKIEGEEEVEKMDALLSLAITGGDCNWI